VPHGRQEDPVSASDLADVGAVAPARWYHVEGEQRHGPVDLQQMRRLVLDRVVGPDTLVWADGMPDWTPAVRVPAITPPASLRPAAGWPAVDGS
jgi:hypothetical protein